MVSVFNLERDLLLRDEIRSAEQFRDIEKIFAARGFTPGANSVLFIDEAQESTTFGGFVRFMKEEWMFATVILTGSSITKIFSEESRVPVGRLEYLRVTPLTFAEFALNSADADQFEEARRVPLHITDYTHRMLMQRYDHYLRVGGMPAIVQQFQSGAEMHELEIAWQEIFLSQQEDFIRKEPKLKPHLFREGAQAVADLLGSTFSLTRVSQNHRDAKLAIATLCEWQIVYRCDQPTVSPTSEPRPKLYLHDLGLARSLRGTSLPS